MSGDLPDYHSYVTPVTVNIPPGETPQTWIAKYQSAPADLPDGSTGPLLVDIKGRLYVVQYEKDRTVETAAGKFVRVKGATTDEVSVTLSQQDIIPRPKGGILAKGSGTTTASYATVASRVVTNGKSFQLAKILVSCNQDVMYKLRWNGTDISAEVLLSAKIPLTDWFPWNYYSMPGDGAKIFDIQVKYPSGGSAGTCFAEIVGEEV